MTDTLSHPESARPLVTTNAVITKATLTSDDHGLLSSYIYLDYGGSGQGFGGYALYLPKDWKHSGGPNYAGHWIFRVMEVAGVTRWDELVGKTVRVKQEHIKVHAIGHIVKDDWFTPSEDFAAMEAEYDAKAGAK